MQIFLLNKVSFGEFQAFVWNSLIFCIKNVQKKVFIIVLIYDIIYFGDLGEAV